MNAYQTEKRIEFLILGVKGLKDQKLMICTIQMPQKCLCLLYVHKIWNVTHWFHFQVSIRHIGWLSMLL